MKSILNIFYFYYLVVQSLFLTANFGSLRGTIPKQHQMVFLRKKGEKDKKQRMLFAENQVKGPTRKPVPDLSGDLKKIFTDMLLQEKRGKAVAEIFTKNEC